MWHVTRKHLSVEFSCYSHFSNVIGLLLLLRFKSTPRLTNLIGLIILRYAIPRNPDFFYMWPQFQLLICCSIIPAIQQNAKTLEHSLLNVLIDVPLNKQWRLYTWTPWKGIILGRRRLCSTFISGLGSKLTPLTETMHNNPFLSYLKTNKKINWYPKPLPLLQMANTKLTSTKSMV